MNAERRMKSEENSFLILRSAFCVLHSVFTTPAVSSPREGALLATFPGVDYIEIDSLFSEDELMVRQTVRDFVDEEVLPIIEHAHREEKFPMHLIPKMAEMGLFGATIHEYG